MRFVLIDQILYSDPGRRIQGIKHVGVDDYYLTRDKAGNFTYIHALVGEILGQLAAWSVMQATDFKQRPVAGIVDEVEFHRPAALGETLWVDVTIDELDAEAVLYHGHVQVGSEILFRLQGALGPLLAMEELVEEAVARNQFKDIYRPVSEHALCFETEAARHHPERIQRSCMDPTTVLHHPRMTYDWIQDFEAGRFLKAIKAISYAAVFFSDHFPNKPVLPMTVLLECQLNLADDFLSLSAFASNYRVSSMRKIKMNRFIHPGNVVLCELKLKKQDETELVLSFQNSIDGKRVAVMDLVMRAGVDD